MSKLPAFRISSDWLRQVRCWRTPALRRVAVLSAVSCLCGSPAHAHPEIEAQLAHVSEAIARTPDNAELYLQRGQLHRAHRDWQAGLEDLRRAEELDPDLHLVTRAIGRLLLEADKPQQALEVLGVFLQHRAGDPDGLILRGRAHAKLGGTLEAAADFDAALPKLRRPTPELFIERAKIVLAGGEQFRTRALAGLDEGIGRLGDLYTLHRLAAELEIASGQTGAALRRSRQLVNKFDKNLSWRIFEAELLVSVEKADEARDAYREALELIAALPAHRRRTQAVSDAEHSIREALGALGADG